MASNDSAKKRARQIARRTQVNRARLSRIRTFMRKVEQAIASGNKKQATAALHAVEPEMARGVSKGILHCNMVARKLSRLSAHVRAMGS